MTQTPIHAAGVVLLRGDQGRYETLVVHRPHREDWSLPKGKVDVGEHVIAAAVRECDEETGVQAILGARLPTQEYEAFGLPKLVDYWAARVGGVEDFTPNEEVDETRWVPTAQARSLLTYPHDAELVEQASTLPRTYPLIVLRHAQAAKRSDFKGKHDHQRPVSGKGRSQAKALTSLLDAYGITAVHSSDAERCLQTVKKYARATGVPVLAEPTLSEEGFDANPRKSAARVRDLVGQRHAMVICSHRPVLPTILETLAECMHEDPSRPAWEPRMQPASFIVLHRAFAPDGSPRLVSIERHQLQE